MDYLDIINTRKVNIGGKDMIDVERVMDAIASLQVQEFEDMSEDVKQNHELYLYGFGHGVKHGSHDLKSDIATEIKKRRKIGSTRKIEGYNQGIEDAIQTVMELDKDNV